MKLKKSIMVLFIVLVGALSPLSAQSEMQLLKKKIYDFYSTQLSVDQPDLEVQIVNTPHVDFNNFLPATVRVDSRRRQPIIGIQTIQVSFKTNNGQTRKYVMTVDVSVKRQVLTAARKINREEAFSAENLILRRVSISNPFQEYFLEPSELTGKVAARVIKPGELLQSSMLKNMPDAQRGTNVEIQIDKGSLTVSAEGRLKTDARVGETVSVLCTETGKVLSGVLIAPGRVAIIDSRGEL